MYRPIATYRVQLSPSFGFREAQKIPDYLNDLGISDIYVSPVFRPRQGSQHGYDVVDQNTLNPELGSREDFEVLIDGLHALGMGWIQDIVPNHMAFDSQNAPLMDVMENGSHSRYFTFFDFQWDHPYDRIQGKILVPFLGKFYNEALEEGEISLQFDQDGFSVNYYDIRLPVRVKSYGEVLTHNFSRLRQHLSDDHPDYVKFLGVLYAIRSLSPDGDIAARYDQIHFIKRMLSDLYQENEAIRRVIDENLRTFNGEPGDSESFDLLHNLLNEQYFRLAFWKVGTEEINYRRFFNLNEFISLNMDDTEVFQETHRLLFELLEEENFQGLRIDHIDGLFNPRRYLKRLRNRFPEMYLVVEKILEQNEPLPDFWPVQGTTGYDFLNYANGLFCQKEHRSQFEKIYRKFTGFGTGYDQLIHEKKRLIIGKHMAGDVDNLAHMLAQIAGRYRYGSDFTLYGLRRALVEILAWFPVYRTYISEDFRRESDRHYIDETVRRAKRTMPDFSREFEFIRTLLYLDFGDQMIEEEQSQWINFVMRFQQMTGPLMAKGFEDTALYIYNRLVSLNDVGGYPEAFGNSDIEFHHFNIERAENWPHSMNATATHDTKRGEDVRARLNVLSEIPREWEQQVNYWSRLNEEKKRTVGDNLAVPDSNDEFLLYQTLVGTFPFDGVITGEYVDRIKNYIVKAVRESKIHTEWLKPDTEYEEAFTEFVEAILLDGSDNIFLREFRSFHEQIARFGIWNSLSQTLLKITSPGIPDFYQGSELWDLHLVDPDNRRPVDYTLRRKYLNQLQKKEKHGIPNLLGELFDKKEDGRLKLYLIYRALHARAQYNTLFEQGTYTPLKVNGHRKNHIIAFARSNDDHRALVVVPRFLTELLQEGELPLGEDVWNDTRVAASPDVSEWQDAVTGTVLPSADELYLSTVFAHFPGAMLIGSTAG
ncbi:MAG TPA: malto-oligosyltrehalose synthase [bacterium]|nr:malto-oligosyltrehalose synthase [bacterium]